MSKKEEEVEKPKKAHKEEVKKDEEVIAPELDHRGVIMGR